MLSVNHHNIELPSNKKFGFFFTIIFMLAGVGFFFVDISNLAWLLFGLAIVMLFITLINSDVLHPLNKLWMLFGIFLGLIVSPIILGIIFFLLITPIGLLIRIFGRDELRLKLKSQASYWKLRALSDHINENFKNQF